mmetsp:Transcript_22983/g.47027  ORF Transcript_22983/g.47027 Transcript_22983/m.47027 type:complete len:264 (-) Transcript_22983:655-1446(-)
MHQTHSQTRKVGAFLLHVLPVAAVSAVVARRARFGLHHPHKRFGLLHVRGGLELQTSPVGEQQRLVPNVLGALLPVRRAVAALPVKPHHPVVELRGGVWVRVVLEAVHRAARHYVLHRHAPHRGQPLQRAFHFKSGGVKRQRPGGVALETESEVAPQRVHPLHGPSSAACFPHHGGVGVGVPKREQGGVVVQRPHVAARFRESQKQLHRAALAAHRGRVVGGGRVGVNGYVRAQACRELLFKGRHALVGPHHQHGLVAPRRGR